MYGQFYYFWGRFSINTSFINLLLATTPTLLILDIDQVTPEVEKEIRDLRRHGPMTIEKLTGVHFSVVMDVLRKYGYY
jgi:hypothetical protein